MLKSIIYGEIGVFIISLIWSWHWAKRAKLQGVVSKKVVIDKSAFWQTFGVLSFILFCLIFQDELPS